MRELISPGVLILGLDIVYQLIKDGMLVSEYYSHVSSETIFKIPSDDDVEQQYEQVFKQGM